MDDHIEQFQQGIGKIQEGVSQLTKGPASFTLECLFAAYRTLINQYALFKVGERVVLRDTPAAALQQDSGWWFCRHFLIPGNGATVQHVTCDSSGKLQYDVVFDRETWIDREGKEQPVSSKHVFRLVETDLTKSVFAGEEKFT